jgi:DNA-binding LytR/AlgR family response regulator
MYPINPKTSIWLPDGSTLIQFDKNSIVFIEAADQYSDVYSLNEENRKILNTENDYGKVQFIRTTVSIGLGKLEVLLEEDNFCRVNKSFLVNIGYMHSTCKESGGSVFLFMVRSITYRK